MTGLRIHLKLTIFSLLFLALLPLPSRSAGPVSGQILGGSPDAPIRIEVFSDFQCPSCRELYLDVMRRTISEYCSQNKVCLIYHEFPLASHRYSRDAARYAEAVSRLGRSQLLKVYDALFMDQAQWSEDGSLAASISKAISPADFQKLKVIMDDPSINAAIEKEIQLGTQHQIRSTPTFFIYTSRRQERVEGRLTYISLKQFLDSNLK
jgi:protein-disulfide isomerase